MLPVRIITEGFQLFLRVLKGASVYHRIFESEDWVFKVSPLASIFDQGGELCQVFATVFILSVVLHQVFYEVARAIIVGTSQREPFQVKVDRLNWRRRALRGHLVNSFDLTDYDWTTPCVAWTSREYTAWGMACNSSLLFHL